LCRRGCEMDRVEQWIRIGPNNGDSNLEVLLVLVSVSVISLLAISVNPRWRRLLRRYLTGSENGSARQIR